MKLKSVKFILDIQSSVIWLEVGQFMPPCAIVYGAETPRWQVKSSQLSQF